MQYENIILTNDYQSDKVSATASRICILIIGIVTLLNELNIFNINKTDMKKTMLIAAGIALLPTIIVNILRISRPLVKYFIVMCFAVECGFLYTFFTIHVIFLFAFPLAISSLYYNKRLSIFAVVISIISMVTSHIIAKDYAFIYTVSFVSVKDVLMFLVMPCILQFMCFAYVNISLSQRTRNLLDTMYGYLTESKRSNDSMDVILNYSKLLFSEKDITLMPELIFNEMKQIFLTLEKLSPDEVYGEVGIIEGNKRVFCADSTSKSWHTQFKNDFFTVKIKKHKYTFYLQNNKSSLQIDPDRIVMTFYDENNFLGYSVFYCPIKKNDPITNKIINICFSDIKLAIKNVVLSNEMFKTQEELVRAFAEISESKSKQTGQHIKRVSEYMRIMCNAVHLNKTEIDSVVIASMMHDIGKLMIPENILEKPGRLTNEEYQVIKNHVKYGYDLLANSPGKVMQIGKTIALQHHEKWDGTGYLGYKGEDIDYYSRLMALVDVFDALVSKRSYKGSWTIDDTYNEIVAQSGRQFDPVVVELFKENYDKFLAILNSYPDDES